MAGWTVLLAVAGFLQFCLFRPAIGNFTGRATSQRKIDFPTLFYPGPDRKFVTLAPHEIPVSSVGLGRFKLRGRANENAQLEIPNLHPNSIPDSNNGVRSPLQVINLRPKGQQSPSLFEQEANFNDQPIEPEGSQFPFVSAPATKHQERVNNLRRPHVLNVPRPNKNKALRPYPVGGLPLTSLVISPPNGGQTVIHAQRQPHLLEGPGPAQMSSPRPTPPPPRLTEKPFQQFLNPSVNQGFQGTFEDESEILFTPPPNRRPPPPSTPSPLRSPHAFQNPQNPSSKVHFHHSNAINNNPTVNSKTQIQWKPQPQFRPSPPTLPHQQLVQSSMMRENHVVHNGGGEESTLHQIPRTRFSCRDWQMSGYYADMEADCTVFHVCYEKRQFTFKCPNGTLFDQRYLVCGWWYGVDCSNSAAYYAVNAMFLTDERLNKNKF